MHPVGAQTRELLQKLKPGEALQQELLQKYDVALEAFQHELVTLLKELALSDLVEIGNGTIRYMPAPVTREEMLCDTNGVPGGDQ